jgi:hypothetical protein
MAVLFGGRCLMLQHSAQQSVVATHMCSVGFDVVLCSKSAVKAELSA